MGYCIEQRASDFRVKKENFKPMLKAIESLMALTDRMSGGSSYREKWFAWVDTSKVLQGVENNDIFYAMEAWRWFVERDEEGNISGIFFEGEKYGDDDLLMAAIAPYVENGCYIEMQGEDGEMWRWCFDHGKLINKEAKIVWE
jgi:hypothetical protein